MKSFLQAYDLGLVVGSDLAELLPCLDAIEHRHGGVGGCAAGIRAGAGFRQLLVPHAEAALIDEGIERVGLCAPGIDQKQGRELRRDRPSAHLPEGEHQRGRDHGAGGRVGRVGVEEIRERLGPAGGRTGWLGCLHVTLGVSWTGRRWCGRVPHAATCYRQGPHVPCFQECSATQDTARWEGCGTCGRGRGVRVDRLRAC